MVRRATQGEPAVEGSSFVCFLGAGGVPLTAEPSVLHGVETVFELRNGDFPQESTWLGPLTYQVFSLVQRNKPLGWPEEGGTQDPSQSSAGWSLSSPGILLEAPFPSTERHGV